MDASSSSAPISPTLATKIVQRACDCCRKRKVKCDGSAPCGPCTKASIRCAYLQPPKKKGPKGLRSARVLHALRTIDDTAAIGPTIPTTRPDQSSAPDTWLRNSPHGSQSVAPYKYGTSLLTNQASYHPMQLPSSAAEQSQQHSCVMHLSQFYQHDIQYQQEWASHPASFASDTTTSPTTSESGHRRLAAQHFLPYVRLFFTHMFPIMPIIDPKVYLDPALYTNCGDLSSETYCFLCSICAATIVQLDASIPQPQPLHPLQSIDELFVEECLRERGRYDYINGLTTMSVMTSFFLFAYFGNQEKHIKAWHYLQESITFVENLNMDDEDRYVKLDAVQAHWHRRLYWLLFITERAYAVQRRKRTRLHPTVQLPAIFESEEPQLLDGFVNLANLFSAVDDSFVSAWRGTERASLCDEGWLSTTQKRLDTVAVALANISETQNVDISVTREWLHVLAWQMGVSHGLILGQGNGSGDMGLHYPIELARKVVVITRSAQAPALDAHGIGMEQKLSDIAGCLADVLKCTTGDSSRRFSEGRGYLNALLQRLSSMRGRESRCLKPLMDKMDGLMGYEIGHRSLPLPSETVSTVSHPHAFRIEHPVYLRTPSSVRDSVGMLRTLSISGKLGMPGLMASPQDTEQRRPSGRVYAEMEVEDMGDTSAVVDEQWQISI